MIILNGTQSIRKDLGPVVATIGNFDGIHLGHRKIIERVLEKGKELNFATVVITFDPHPSHVISPAQAPHLIHTRHQKIRMLEQIGIDYLLFIHFNRNLSLLTAEDFLSRYVLDRMKIREMYVGEDFRLGKDRITDSSTLSSIGAKLGFSVGLIESVTIDDQIISSTTIRQMIEDGDVEKAARFLGHNYSIEGEVVSGEGIGRTMKIPTANIRPENKLIPKMGVYITESLVSGSLYASVTNVGVRPTFNLYTSMIETHLIDFRSSIYGEDIEVFFYRRVRDEKKFDDADKLKKQIEADITQARDFFSGR